MGDVTTGGSSTTPNSELVGPTADMLLKGLQKAYKGGVDVYDKPLYTPPSSATQDAWHQGSDYASTIAGMGGLSPIMQNALGTFGQVGAGYGTAGNNARSNLAPIINGYGEASASSDAMLSPLYESYNGLRSNGGLTDGQSSAMGGLGGLGSQFAGLGGLTSGQQGNLNTTNGAGAGFGALTQNGGLSAAQSAAMGKTSGIGDAYGGLAGAFDQSAPGYDRMRQKLLDDAVKNVGSGFTASGRFGGGSYINDATEASLNAIAPLDYQNYTNSVNNKYRSLDSQKGIFDTLFGEGQAGIGNQIAGLSGQLGAAGQGFSMGQQGRDNSFGALGAQQGVYNDTFNMGQTGRGNEMAALAAQGNTAQNITNNRLAGLAGRAGTANSIFANDAAMLAGQQGAASSLFNGGQQGINNTNQAIGQLGAIGASQDADSLAQRLASADLYDKQHNADWNTLGRASSLFGGTSGASGTTTSNNVPWWAALLGGASTGASIFG